MIDSAVERWFVEADTNTVLLWLEREDDSDACAENEIRFVRLRRPLMQLIPPPDDPKRREGLENLTDEILEATPGSDDPRFLANLVTQGTDGGIEFAAETPADDELTADDEDEEP